MFKLPSRKVKAEVANKKSCELVSGGYIKCDPIELVNKVIELEHRIFAFEEEKKRIADVSKQIVGALNVRLAFNRTGTVSYQMLIDVLEALTKEENNGK